MNNRRGAERRKQVQKRRAAVYGLIPWAVILLNLFLLFRMRGELDALSREVESIRELLSGSAGAVRTESVPVNVSGGGRNGLCKPARPGGGGSSEGAQRP